MLLFLNKGRGLFGEGEPIGELGKKIGFAGIGGNGGLRSVSVGGGDFSFKRGGSDGGMEFSVLLYKL